MLVTLATRVSTNKLLAVINDALIIEDVMVFKFAPFNPIMEPDTVKLPVI